MAMYTCMHVDKAKEELFIQCVCDLRISRRVSLSFSPSPHMFGAFYGCQKARASFVYYYYARVWVGWIDANGMSLL